MSSFKDIPSYHKLKNLHVGENAYIFGAGTSLFGEDFSFVHDKGIVISVNSSIMLMPWKNGSPHRRYWVSNDRSVMKWSYWHNILFSNCKKVIRNSWESAYNGFSIEDFYVFKPRPTSEGIIDPKDIGLAYCSSVPSSIDLAIQMGCKQIFLFGVDHYALGSRSHFWQLLEKDQQPHRFGVSLPDSMQAQRKAFGFNLIAYKALSDFAKYNGCEIYNCNLKSRIKSFKKITIENARNI